LDRSGTAGGTTPEIVIGTKTQTFGRSQQARSGVFPYSGRPAGPPALERDDFSSSHHPAKLLVVRDLFRKPVPTFRDHAKLLVCARSLPKTGAHFSGSRQASCLRVISSENRCPLFGITRQAGDGRMQEYVFEVPLVAIVRVRASNSEMAREVVVSPVVSPPSSEEIRLANEANFETGKRAPIIDVTFSVKDAELRLVDIDGRPVIE
jgi:hypothetical protein